MKMVHPCPRTVGDGDAALYLSYTGDRRPLCWSAEFARALGFEREWLPDLLVFHVIFGKTVADISQNAVANLGYADVRFLAPVYPGTTLRAESEVIGLRETSSGKTGIVYVKTSGIDQNRREVLRFNRWVLVEKSSDAAAGDAVVPELPTQVAPAELAPPPFKLDRFSDVAWATGGARLFEDYQKGDRIVHPTGMTIDDADHTGATRLYQNTARVHFDARAMAESKVGKRLVYGGHVISVAHALSYSGLENVLCMAAWNGGNHVNPTVGGDTLYAYTDVVDAAPIKGRKDIGALRLRLVAVKNVDPNREPVETQSAEGAYDPHVVLDLDYWGIIPRKR
jgi:2-methylfumaryl-CoA hydratase